ncbi:MAG: Na+/H+ antiporter [Bryobacterales bacterium]|nr:Na+/H+ antiporter [Bryobacterales bacterium]
MSLGTVFLLVVAAVTIALVAKRLDQPYPIALVVGGLLIALIPNVPRWQLSPELVFEVMLPPILAEAAYFTSWRDFWRWRRAIFLLAFGLVVATSAAVAAFCVHFIPGMPWAVGFVLGAIVAPPDAAAATAILRKLPLPKRIVQIVEGESLVNDAAALTIFRFAVAAVVSGAFSFRQAALAFLWVSLGGVAIGFAVVWVYLKLYPKVKDPDIEIISTFLVTYASFGLAETAHASGVLAVVTTGIILGCSASDVFSATMRIRAVAVWQTVIFLINAVVFILIGLQMPLVLEALRGYRDRDLLFWCAGLSLLVIVVRFAWVFPGAYLPRLLSARIRENEPDPTWRGVTLVSWTGLRGIVSLAAALSLPQTTNSGAPFPFRELILLLTFAVILATLLLQGLTLRPLILALKLPADRSSESEQLAARVFAAERALARLAEIEGAGGIPATVLDRVRGYFEDRLAGLRAELERELGAELPTQPEQFQTIAEQRIWWELARVERSAILQLRREQKIGDEAMRDIERDIDLLEARIVPGGSKGGAIPA